jgi:hypothetical protein
LKDDSGNIISQATPGSLVNNTLYRDTLILQQGCYDLTIHDQGKNGLSFFANNEGSGFARIQKADGTSVILKTFEADFGTMISHRFTVGYTTHIQEINNDIIFNAYPNPATDKIHFDISLPKNEKLTIRMYNMEGKLKFQKEFDSSVFPEISLDEFSSGIYYITCQGANWMKGQKMVILR